MIAVLVILLILLLYFVFVSLCSIGVIKSVSHSTLECDVKTDIDVYVVISMFNSEGVAQNIVNGLRAQNYKDFSVILINDGSSDNTSSVLRELIKELPAFRLIDIDHRGKDRAIKGLLSGELGVSLGDSLVIVSDADCSWPVDWVGSVVTTYRNSGASLLIGPVIIDGSHPFQATEFLSVQGVTIGSAAIGHPLLCGGANLAFTSEAYMRVHSLLPDYIEHGGDMYLLQAMKRSGERIVAVDGPGSVVVTSGLTSFSSFASQRARWASKGTKYVDKEILLAAALVLSVQISLIIALVLSFIFPKLLLLWVVKFLTDLPLLVLTAMKLEQTKLIPYILPVSVIYPFYVIFVVIKSLLR